MLYPVKRFSIKPEILIKLYWEEGFNLLQIGKKLHLASRTINIRMKECGIPLRKSGVPGPNITKKELRKLYMIQKLSSRKIAKIYKCAYSTIDNKIRKFGFPIKTLAAAHIVNIRRNFSGNLEEKAYLLGFRIGDLRTRKRYLNSETVLVDCGSTKSKQISLIKNLFSGYGRVWISKPSKTNKTQIECLLDLSFSFLLHKYKMIPGWCLKNDNHFLNFLAGFTDAEGSFFLLKTHNSSAFSIGNYNLKILKQIRSYLKKLGLKSSIRAGYKAGYTDKHGYVRNGDYWNLSIIKKYDLYHFTNLILRFLKHKQKIIDAKRVIKNIDCRNQKYGFIGMQS